MAKTRGIVLKSAREIEAMRRAGGLVRQVLERMAEVAEAGVTTGRLNEIAEEMIAAAGATPLFKGVVNPDARLPFPAALCTSVNEEVVHGIPGDRALCSGDIISIDCGVRLDGYCGDSAVTLAVGEVTPEIEKLMRVTRRSLEMVIEQARPGVMWSELAKQVQAFVEGERLSVVRDFVGHGIGRDLHEEPKVPNYWDKKRGNKDFRLEAGMVLAVEPMVNLGTASVEYGDDDRWVVVTRDRRAAAHYEHTIAITASGCDVLTRGNGVVAKAV